MPVRRVRAGMFSDPGIRLIPEVNRSKNSTAMVLFKRLPKLRWSAARDAEIVPAEAQAKHPSLAPDFKTLDDELIPHFRESDTSALLVQNQFRRDQVILIFGGALASIFGVLHATLGKGGAMWTGIIEAVLAAVLSAVALREKTARAQECYFSDRLKAETLRTEYILFLGRIGKYADENDRRRHLIRRIAEIKTGAQT